MEHPGQDPVRRRALARVPFAVTALVLLLAPLVLSEFRLGLLGKFLALALVALGQDLIWGYGGMLSLGQGLFFGLGAYAMAMYLKLESSAGSLPDFMSWSGRETLPAFWEPFHHAAFAIPAAVLAPAALAYLVGYLIFRSRVKGVYFSLITQALTLIASILFIGQQAVTGGTNGITNLKTIFGALRREASTQIVLYLITVVVLGVAYLALRRLVASRFGRLLVAVRDDEDRVRFLGHDPASVKSRAFALSAAMAGLGGALYVAQVGIISPSALAVVPSLEIVIWVAVGGRATLAGAIAGALIVNWSKSLISESYPEVWQYLFGALFAGSVVLFPAGLLGGVARLQARLPPARGVGRGGERTG